MKELNSSTLNGKAVKIKLKNGSSQIGFLPIQSNNEIFEKTQIAFLPWDKSDDFYAFFKARTTVSNQDLQKYVKYINREEIDSYEIMESEISVIGIENGKPVPNWLKLQLYKKAKPGHLAAKYKIPGNSKWFELGELQIIDRQITLPLTLLFLSYAKEDKKTVKLAMNDLHDNGVLTWFDEKDLLPGDDWEAKIEEAIEKSDYVLVFLSSKTIDKVGYKNKEIKYALDQYSLRPSGKRYIIPILLDECTPPREFKGIHWLKATEENWFEKLLVSIGKYPIDKDIID
ncbi:MAG: toll/interleukin-1 receptor domain-containing protein [Bacteroidia bacterium]